MKMQIVTGWADGGLRKFELASYLQRSPEIDDDTNEIASSDHTEWTIATDSERDFIRNIIVIEGRLICSTNLGGLYLIETTQASKSVGETDKNEKLLFKSILLSNYTVISKIKTTGNKWILAIGTLKGFIYLLTISFESRSGTKKEEITIDCINLLSIEEELAENDGGISAKSSQLINTIGSTKIFNLIWIEYKGRYFLLACFALINGLMHLYELDSSKQLQLVARLYLPVCKQRWLTSFSIISIQKLEDNNKGIYKKRTKLRVVQIYKKKVFSNF
jgi:hypothetical protein